MEYEVDTYTLEYVENEDKYYISFKDSIGNNCRLEIEKEIFDVYMKSKKAYKKIQNEFDRHQEQSHLSDISLYNRSLNKKEDVADEVIVNILKKQLTKAKQELTETQRRRIELHFEYGLTLENIAEIEGVGKKKIDKSIALGMKKLKKFLKVGGQNSV